MEVLLVMVSLQVMEKAMLSRLVKTVPIGSLMVQGCSMVSRFTFISVGVMMPQVSRGG
jgi:hypothetical protein